MESNPNSQKGLPAELMAPAAHLHAALQSRNGLPEALSTYCGIAFAKHELALPGAAFLAAAFKRDFKTLVEIISPHHLVAELAAGSMALSSVVAAYWDRKERMADLAALADAVISAKRHEADFRPVREFLVALGTTISILHPQQSWQLLEMAAGLGAGDDRADALAEAWEWQKAGEMLASKQDSLRHFWHQQLRQKRGDWFWDTLEGQEAVRGLQQEPESLAEGGSLFRRAVPLWAWAAKAAAEPPPAASPAATPQPAAEVEKPKHSLLASIAPIRSSLPAPIAEDPEAEDEPPSSVAGKKRWGISPLMWAYGGLGAAAAMIVALLSDGEQNSPPPPASVIASAAGEAPREAVAEPSAPPVPVAQQQPVSHSPLASQPAIVVQAETAKPLENETAAAQAAVASADPVSAEPAVPPASDAPVLAALLVPAEHSEKKGWLRTPLGNEFQVTEANCESGKAVDAEGRPWKLPPDPALQAETPGILKAVNPYTGETVPVAEEKWKPGEQIAFANTGWTFRLPDDLPAAAPESPTEPVAAASDPQVSPPAAPPAEEPVLPPSQPSRKAAKTSLLATSKPVIHRSPPQDEPAASESGQPDEPPLPTHEVAPQGEASIDPARLGSTQGSYVPAHLQRNFVTRANSIWMKYRGGYWESKPRAYLNGAGGDPLNWARDMTLRERSVGTIPRGYCFEVANNGVVFVLPVSRQ